MVLDRCDPCEAYCFILLLSFFDPEGFRRYKIVYNAPTSLSNRRRATASLLRIQRLDGMYV